MWVPGSGIVYDRTSCWPQVRFVLPGTIVGTVVRFVATIVPAGECFAKRHIIQWFSTQITLFADYTKESLIRKLFTFQSRDNSINVKLLDKLRNKVIAVLLALRVIRL